MTPPSELNHLSSDSTQAGLQVHHVPAGLEYVHHQPAGLEYGHPETVSSQSSPLMNQRDSVGKELYQGLHQHPGTPLSLKQRLQKRRKLWTAVAVVLAIVVILGIVLGAVLGTRSSKSAENTSSSNSTSSPSTGAARLASTSGTFNGTGMVMIDTPYLPGTNHAQGVVAFQDYTAKLNLVQWAFSNDQIQSLSQPIILDFELANGTGIAGAWTDFSDREFGNYILVYIRPDGVLADIWSNSTAGLANWSPGNLSSMGWKAPTDRRAAITMNWDPYCFGRELGNGGGIKLWAGGLDGNVHQYSYDMPSGMWNTQDYIFEGLSAYGGIKRTTGSQAFNCVNNTLFATDSSGEIVYVTADMHNSTNWPVGGQWSNITRSGRKTVSPDSSLAEGMYASANGNDYIYYPGPGGKLFGQNVDGSPSLSSSTGLFTTLNSQIGDVGVMAGTEFGEFLTGSETLLVFQSGGSSLDWAVVSSATQVQHGNFFH